MSATARNLLLLGLAALVARILAVVVLPWPPFTDPAYYSLVAQRLTEGHGFTIPVIYSFLEVGSRLPEVPTLPVPSNAHWMPLTSVVAAASMAILGPTYVAGTVPLVVLSALLPPLTYLVSMRLWGSQAGAWAAGIMAIFAGPLLILYPTTDNFAVFGAVGAASLFCAMRAVSAERPGPWLAAAGAFAGFATLARIDGVLLTFAVATAWLVRRGWTPWRGEPIGGATLGWGLASAGAYLLVMAPWFARNLATFGVPLPSTGGHTIWIRSYNEQFSIGHEVGLASYLDWGAANIIGSKLESWVELVGRTAVLLGGTFVIFFVVGLWLFRRRAQLAPFLVYFVVMFVAMGGLFTFHAPKGAFYHSAPAWLPWAIPLSIAAVAPVLTGAGRWWRFLRRPATHRFVIAAGLVGSVVLSIVGSSILHRQWDRSRQRDEQAAAFLRANADPTDVIMASDPASLYPLTGIPGVAAPFDPYRITARVVDAYDVTWVVVLRPNEPGAVDPLGLWDGAAGTDSEGAHPTFLPPAPAFEGDDVRIFRVVGG